MFLDDPEFSEGRGREFESRRARQYFNDLDDPIQASVPGVSRRKGSAFDFGSGAFKAQV
jgi:hypothetical protein